MAGEVGIEPNPRRSDCLSKTGVAPATPSPIVTRYVMADDKRIELSTN
jgi:hypothetical protein